MAGGLGQRFFMKWSSQQEAALKLCEQWLRDSTADQVFYLAGYAGTGKTTLAKHLAAGVSGTVLYAAYTGKAASVMRKSGCPDAKTIHKLIYIPTTDDGSHLDNLKAELVELEKIDPKSHGTLKRIMVVQRAIQEAIQKTKKLSFTLKEYSNLSNASLCIIDEVSMVSQRMMEDLCSFGVRILVLGDPAQLPPVKGLGAFTNREPDMMLTEIHRQANDNPIIRLATDVRNGKLLCLGDYGRAKVVSKIEAEDALEASQILCGRNQKRRVINKRCRHLKGWSESALPVAGEKIVCLRNNHDKGLLNGTLWFVVENYQGGALLIRDDEGFQQSVPIEEIGFTNEDEIPYFPNGEVFTWGYCLTVHKSQGSQWPNVLLFDDWTRQKSHKKWLYTGITRAQEQLTLVI